MISTRRNYTHGYVINQDFDESMKPTSDSPVFNVKFLIFTDASFCSM